MTDTKRFFPTSLALVSALILMALLLGYGCNGPEVNKNGASSPETKALASVTCGTASNDQVVNAIYKAIDDKYLTSHAWQFNITASGSNVKIVGWSTKRDDILKHAKDAATGCTFDATNFKSKREELSDDFRVTHTCNQGYTPCGDVCILAGEYCKVTGSTTFTNSNVATDSDTHSNSTTNVNTNSNTNTKTNTNTTPAANGRS